MRNPLFFALGKKAFLKDMDAVLTDCFPTFALCFFLLFGSVSLFCPGRRFCITSESKEGNHSSSNKE